MGQIWQFHGWLEKEGRAEGERETRRQHSEDLSWQELILHGIKLSRGRMWAHRVTTACRHKGCTNPRVISSASLCPSLVGWQLCLERGCGAGRDRACGEHEEKG